MDSLLATSGWRTFHFDSPSQRITALRDIYADIERQPAWADYMARIAQLRDATRTELEKGTLDKWGHPHDDERRALLYALDVLLTYVPTIKRDAEAHDKRIEEQQRRASTSGKLHGDDYSNQGGVAF